MPEIQTAQEIAASPYVFGILFIILSFLFYKWVNKHNEEIKLENREREEKIEKLYEDHRIESKEREKNLMDHLKQSNDTQEKTSNTLEKIEGSLHALEKRMDEGFDNVWKQIEKFEK
ncbi:hypothetical protein LCM23_06070 [Cytobacillus kochii]|uniref:hypothetical protein n=1 Tax=Cytobacillus kochii TaxID=859143 RepID=UPI001CD3A313|nr:hypothetical protein [Cytobacillus kochii]MCA1025652.1 hypothetical protein [Cytobacillus kochii]